MKISRFLGKDMREALALVTQELGPDAVILSNKRVEGGVEVVAATDYDEQRIRARAQGLPVQTARSAAPARFESPAPKSGPAVPPLDRLAVRPAALAPESVSSHLPSLQVEQSGLETEAAISALRSEMGEEMRLMRSMLEDQLAGLAWNDARRRSPHKVMLLERLARLGLSPGVANALCEAVNVRDSFDASWQAALLKLSQAIPVSNDDILTAGGVVSLVGTTGVGKTTTIAKLAARYALAHGADNVALISTDCYRIAAHEQLRTYGQILGCAVKLVDKPDALTQALQQYAGKRLVLIDTAGSGQRDQQLGERLNLLAAQGQRVQNYLVLSCTAQKAALEESVRAFSRLPLTGCVLTKLDECGNLGDALSTLVQHRLPLAYVGDGQRVPEDLKIGRGVHLVNQAIALAKTHGDEVCPRRLARFAQASGSL